MEKMKQHVSIPGLLKKARRQFDKIPDLIKSRSRISLTNCFRKPFNQIFAALQRQKVLERYEYYNKHYLISIDGTSCFSSHKVHCESCCVKNHRNGKKTYYHQMLGAMMVHPNEKTVIPLAPEPILKQDGYKKNDCESNAAKRLLESMHREHPHLKMIIVEDALYANAPHINLLKKLNMRYIIGVKPDNHTYLFEFAKAVQMHEQEDRDKDGTVRRYRWYNKLPLNDSNADCEVNFLEYDEISPKGKIQHFTWVTDISLSPSTVQLVMKGGRSRWKIENETFNTLKNQGYNFEHNYGHGYNHLSTVMAMLMFLAFLVDQAQEACCKLFQGALAKMKSRAMLWENIRGLFYHFFILSWQDFYKAIANSCYGGILQPDTS